MPSEPQAIKVVALSWAGNRDAGLTKAVLGRPWQKDGKVYWHEGKVIELDVDRGRPGEEDGINAAELFG